MREFHPIAESFPLMAGKDFADLVADIRAHGLKVPIIIDDDGRILDGRNRARACDEIGIEPDHVRWDGDGTPEALVISLNIHRRHLIAKLRAMIVARLVTTERGSNQHLPGGRSCLTVADAAALGDVSVHSVDRARVVLQHGDPEIIAAVEHGALGLEPAVRLIHSKRPKPTNARARTRDERAARVKEIGELAARGYASRQMAKIIGVGEEHIRALMRKHGIACPGDEAIKGQRRVSSTQLLDNLVFAAENLTATAGLIDLDEIDRRRITSSVDALKHARKDLDAFIRLLTARKDKTDADEDTEARARSQDLSGRDSADARTARARHSA